MALPTAKIGVELEFDDNVTVTVFEGDIVNDLVYDVGTGETTITGCVRVIDATTKLNSTIPANCPPEPYAHRYVTPYALVIDSSDDYKAELTRVNITDIVSVGEVQPDGGAIVIGPGSSYRTLDVVLAEAPVGAEIKLLDGEYTAPLAFTKAVHIVGSTKTVLSGAITVNMPATTPDTGMTPAEVVLENLTLSGDALIDVTECDSFVMRHCAFKEHNMPVARTMPISIGATSVTSPMKLTIEKCIFEDQPANSYNLIDVYAKLSECNIIGNYFSDMSCTHNVLSVYGSAPDCVINVEDNVLERPTGGMRFGMLGEPTGKVNINNNTVMALEPLRPWYGMVLFQPYGTQTTSFAGVTLDMMGNSIPAPKLQYWVYSGSSDTQLDATTVPKVILNGLEEVPHVYTPSDLPQV